ncbi:ATP-binding protein, partial [Streptomyces sp. NPDC055036]
AAPKGCTAGSGRGPLEKDLHHRNLASGLPVLVHGEGGDATVRIDLSGGSLRIRVYDGSTDEAHITIAAPEDESGRGMVIVNAIVAQLSGTWGVCDSGRTTWCEIPAGMPPRGADS